MFTFRAGLSFALLLGVGFTRAADDHAQDISRALSQRFETVIYSRTNLLETVAYLNSSAYLKEQRIVEQGLRLPFLELISGLHTVSPSIVEDAKSQFDSAFVGARDFRGPQGLGLALSRQCYILVSRRPISGGTIKRLFAATPQKSLGGLTVYTWELAPFEGRPAPTKFYAVFIGDLYLLVANDSSALLDTVSALTQSGADKDVALPDGSKLSLLVKGSSYWAYRRFEESSAHRAPIKEARALVFHFEARGNRGAIDVFSASEGPPVLFSRAGSFRASGKDHWMLQAMFTDKSPAAANLLEILAAFGFGLAL